MPYGGKASREESRATGGVLSVRGDMIDVCVIGAVEDITDGGVDDEDVDADDADVGSGVVVSGGIFVRIVSVRVDVDVAASHDNDADDAVHPTIAVASEKQFSSFALVLDRTHFVSPLGSLPSNEPTNAL